MATRHLNPKITSDDEAITGAGQTEVKYYYDYHPTKEDLMAESVVQFNLIQYLILVLRWLYHTEGWFIASNLNIYETTNSIEYPLAPDVAVFKGLVISEEEQATLRSWKILPPDQPAPTVVFEVCSDATWRDDLKLKPEQYQEMGVKEYFAYDPNQPGVWRINRKPTDLRLRGWRYNGEEIVEIPRDARGWMWSQELEKWLVPDGKLLLIYDHNEKRCLTEAEAERQAMQELLAKLRAKGIDPDQL